MNLDQFRDVDLVISKANDNFFQRQFVSQGDYKGRTLTVQVTNNGVIGEVPGLVLNLRWQNQTSGLTDLSAFTLIDKANSVFRIEYPRHMMTPGKVIANIQVIQNGKITHMKPFELTVQELAGEAVGIVEKNEYSALVAVLSDANKFRTDITLLDNKKAEKEYVDHLIKQAASGSPKGISSLNELKSKYPNGTEGIYVAADTGNWYYWSGTAWTVGSTYEGKMISVKSVQTDKLANLVIGKNLFNKDVLEPGYLGRSDGVVIPDTDNVTAGFRYIDSSKGYLTFSKIANGALNVCFYDSNYKFISGSGIQITPDAVHTIAINPEAVFVRFSINRLDVEKMQLEYGQTQSEFEAFYQFDPDQKKIGEDEPPKIESPEQIRRQL